MGVTLLSERQYAERSGIGKTTIRDARVAGRIKNGWDGDLQQYKFEIAEEEWGIPYRKHMEAKGKVFIPKGGKPAVIAPAKNPEADVANGDADFVPPYIPEAEALFADQLDLFHDVNDFKAGKKVDYSEAIRVKEYNEARYKKMRADELAGLLVRKMDVEKQLQVAGMELRKEIERLPTRCIDAVRGAVDRNDAIIVLEDAIVALLERMGGIIETALKNKQ